MGLVSEQALPHNAEIIEPRFCGKATEAIAKTAQLIGFASGGVFGHCRPQLFFNHEIPERHEKFCESVLCGSAALREIYCDPFCSDSPHAWHRAL